MNAISLLRPACPAQAIAEAMSRDLMGIVVPSVPAVTHHTMLSSRDTGGPLCVSDATWPAGAGVPLHANATQDELLIVLSGEIALTLSGRTFRRAAGEPAFIPRGTPHSFQAVTEARVLAVLTRQSLDAPMTERIGRPSAAA